MFLCIFGLRLSRGSRGLSLRLRFKVGVKVEVKVVLRLEVWLRSRLRV